MVRQAQLAVGRPVRLVEHDFAAPRDERDEPELLALGVTGEQCIELFGGERVAGRGCG